MTWDLIVVGGGISGMAVAAMTARQGARVLVLERADFLGGNGRYSAGLVWTAPSYDVLRQRCSDGDPAKQQALIGGFNSTLDVLRGLGVEVGPRLDGLSGFGCGHRIDISATLATLRQVVEQPGGQVRLRARDVRVHTKARSLYTVASSTSGASQIDRSAVLVTATGGFQGSPPLLRRWLGAEAEQMLLRSNRYSGGAGLEIGLALGGSPTPNMGGFYGHLVPSPLASFQPEMFRALTQYQSERCLALNMRGARFVDESLGDPVINQACLRQPGGQAVLVFDECIRNAMAGSPRFPGDQTIDRYAIAVKSGARVVECPDAQRLVAALENWGLPNDATADSILDRFGEDEVRGTLYAMQVQPSITFTYGGLRTDVNGRVLTDDTNVLPGLFAVGADAGGTFGPGYAGGLASSLVSAHLAAGVISGHGGVSHGS